MRSRSAVGLDGEDGIESRTPADGRPTPMTEIAIDFKDAWLRGEAVSIVSEKSTLMADGDRTTENMDVLYLELADGVVDFGDIEIALEPGHFAICAGGLYRRVFPE